MANVGVAIVGGVLLLVGFFASFYYESKAIFGMEYLRIYPYQNVGIALIVASAVLIGIGAIYSPQKKPQQPIVPSPSATTYSFAADHRFCAFCGEKLPQGGTRCPKCGTDVPS